MTKQPVTVFLSYAHEDEPLCDQLKAHLSLLQHQGLVSTWHDRRILPGADWAQEIDTALETAPIVLLLVSARFFASNYCVGVEMKIAMSRHEAGQARVIPIIVRPVNWKGAPFAYLQILPKDAKAITAWSNQDEAWTNVVSGIGRVIEELPLLSVNTSSAALPPIWNIPYPQNPLFTGREELLTQLAATLQTGQPTALSQPQAITGLGGIGKTQLALEYAYRHRRDYRAVLWALADTRENLTSSYLTVATLLNLPEKDEQESARIMVAVKNWLQHNTGWLLILDNADDLALAREFLPQSFRGQVLLTTRAQATGRFARRLEVDILPTEQGTLFLLRRASLLAPDATLEQASEGGRDQARTICQELGGLPLALDQAGAYIEETGCSLSDYLDLFKLEQKALLKRRGAVPVDHPQSVATTFSLTFKKVQQRNKAAIELLKFCSYLAPDVIPLELIVQGATHLGTVLGPVAADAFKLDQALEMLQAYSLVQRDGKNRMLSIHRLVQAVLIDTMSPRQRLQWKERVVRVVNEAFPGGEFEEWTRCGRLLPHALVCVTWIKHVSMPIPVAQVLDKAGTYLRERGQYSEAELLLERALEIRTQYLEAEHPDIARSLNNLAILYEWQGKYEQAEPLCQRALLIFEQYLGVEHPNTAKSLDNLASIYAAQKKYEQAELVCQRGLAIREQHLGTELPDTVRSLNNLAILYCEQGKYEQAEPLYQRALEIREQHLGAEHPDVAHSLHGLAELYQCQRKYEQAEALYQRTLAIREKQLGPTHPETQYTRKGYAAFLRLVGRDPEATVLDTDHESPAEEGH